MDRIDELIAETEFWVEATSFEQQTLWETWNGMIDWEQICEGTCIQVGTLDNRPVNLSLFWARLGKEKHLVCFYEATSQVIDHLQIEEWLKSKIREKTTEHNESISCDAQNFHACLHRLEIKW